MAGEVSKALITLRLANIPFRISPRTRAKVSTNVYYFINNTTRKKVNSMNGSNEFEILLLVQGLIA